MFILSCFCFNHSHTVEDNPHYDQNHMQLENINLQATKTTENNFQKGVIRNSSTSLHSQIPAQKESTDKKKTPKKTNGSKAPKKPKPKDLKKPTEPIPPSKNENTINVIAYKNGVGLDKDVLILTNLLENLGFNVNSVDCTKKKPVPNAYINIFIQISEEYFFPYAEKNYLLPNPEWFNYPNDVISKYDLILCKTKEAERIFLPLNPNSLYISFTSLDRFDNNVQKDFKAPIHLSGGSSQKGTEAVVHAWVNNPSFPSLLLIKHLGKKNYPPIPNLNLVYNYLLDAELINFQNHYGIHLCPSETEGFGHSIIEALSCGCVVVATNAPPMNEFVTDPRCLVGYNFTAPQCLATNYYADPKSIETVMHNLLNLSEDELKKIGERNRQFYLENDLFFKRRIAEVFKKN